MSAAVVTGFSNWPLRYVARITLELRTPVVARAGLDAGSAPADFVRDANGLPVLPGTSLCGILRHACLDRGVAEDDVGALFGVSADIPGSASRLTVSWAHIHDSSDRPVDGLLAPHDPRLACPVLAEARIGARRQHVRISDRGTADGRGKFEEAVVCAGHRFTFDLVLRGDADDSALWQALLALLHDPDLRLGAGSRRGFGAFKVRRRLHAGIFDLRRASEFRAFCALPTRLDAAANLSPVEPPHGARQPRLGVTLRGLHPTTTWLFGGGLPDGDEAIAPVTETVIHWQDDRGTPSRQKLHYLPASGIKGAMAHRLAWHFNRITGRRIREDDVIEDDRNDAVVCLFGSIASGTEAAGRRGLLLFDDLVLAESAATQEIRHVSLDRFTGGARSGLLFSERVITSDAMHRDYRIVLLPASSPITPEIRHAFSAVLDDIRKGRLAFGSGAARGNGRFRCDSVEWDDGGRWLKTGDAGAAAHD